MLRSLSGCTRNVVSSYMRRFTPKFVAVNGVRNSSSETISDAEFDEKYENFFNDCCIDGFDIRRGMTELHREDLVPEPKVTCAALRACRRVNDYALAIRFLEAIRFKCENDSKNEAYQYLLKEIQPTLSELGILTPEEMGYDQPELALVDVDDIH